MYDYAVFTQKPLAFHLKGRLFVWHHIVIGSEECDTVS